MTKASRQFLAIVAALGLGLALIGAFALRELSERAQGQGVAQIGGAFDLVSQNGAPFTDAALKGRPHIVFFGYTHCPDFCPTTLTQISSVFRELGADAKIGALFVSIDPQRDTPEAMKTYLESFDPRIIGVTGNDAQIRTVAKAYRVYFRKQGGGGGAYTMDHTGVIYLMDADGSFVSALNLERPAATVAEDLRRYIQ